MKRIALLFTLLVLISTSASAQTFTAQLFGANELPVLGDPDGTGFAVITITGTSLRYEVRTQNIGIATAAHIHRGSSTVPGPPVVGFAVATLTDGTVTITQQLANDIIANPAGFYVNVHNAEFPGGAVRGQLALGGGPGSRTSYLPVVGKARGAAGTNFVTDLSIINNGGAVATVVLDFFAQTAAGQTAPTATHSVMVAPGEQAVLTDVLNGTLNVSSGLGGLRVASDQNVRVTARVINDLRAEGKGTAGFSVDAKETGATSGSMALLANDADYRTNIGYFNPTPAPLTATFIARRTSDGAVLGANTVTIPGYSMVQQPAFSLISNVPEASRTVSSFHVAWTSSAPLVAYGAVTDNKTGDAVLNQ